MSAADRGGRVAPPPADPSQATGRVKRRDNQLHRARVLEVRIQPPPAESPCLARTERHKVENRGFPAGVRRWAGGVVGRDPQDSSTSRQLPVISLSGLC
jgi:hypothetical protein